MHWSGAAKTFFFLVPRRCWVQVAADNAQYAAVLDEHCKPVTNLLVVLEFSMHKPTPRIVSCTPAMSCRHWKRSLARWILSCWSMVNIGNRVTPFVLVQRPNWLTPIHSYQEHITVAWSMAVMWHQILVYLSDGLQVLQLDQSHQTITNTLTRRVPTILLTHTDYAVWQSPKFYVGDCLTANFTEGGHLARESPTWHPQEPVLPFQHLDDNSRREGDQQERKLQDYIKQYWTLLESSFQQKVQSFWTAGITCSSVSYSR